MPRVTPANLAWLVAYLAMLGSIAFGLRWYRNDATDRYGTEQAGVQWQQWRDAAEELGASGPVRRSKPKAAEPPALLLMRDHFGSCLAISLLLSSVLFLWLMVSLRGALRPPATPLVQDDPETE